MHAQPAVHRASNSVNHLNVAVSLPQVRMSRVNPRASASQMATRLLLNIRPELLCSIDSRAELRFAQMPLLRCRRPLSGADRRFDHRCEFREGRT
jgi:hypothetical protein